jgi:predicted Zn-dependent protease
LAEEKIVENEEFITLDDDEIDELFEDVVIADEDNLPQTNNNKLLYILISAFTVIAFLTLGFLFYIYTNKNKESQDINETKTIIEDVKNIESKTLKPTKSKSYQQLVKKADKLYEDGQKEEALIIREELSLYSKALANYNIGVTKLKEKKYDEAISAFLKSSKHKKLKFESELNIAISAFNKGDNTLFKKHFSEAKNTLSTKVNSPLFSYYTTLINYYQGYFPEALVPLKNRTSSAYLNLQYRLTAKILSSTQNHKEAIKELEKIEDPSDFLTLGLLYAKLKDYEVSKKYLENAIKNQNNTLPAEIALSLVDLKRGMLKQASTMLDKSRSKFSTNAQKIYPIKPILKESLFDPIYAQKEFQNHIFLDDQTKFSLILYFAPYQLMPPTQSISNLSKGTKNIYIDSLRPALDNLNLTDKISDADIQTIKGIKAALNEDLLSAKDIFLKGLTKYPSSSALHYNLALTYAKTYQFDKALKEFQKSATLDNSNYLSTIFARFCSILLHKDDDKTDIELLKERLSSNSENDINQKRAKALIAIAENEIIDIDPMLNKTTFDDVILLSLSKIVQDPNLYKQKATSLLLKAPNDLIANILSIDANHDKLDIKEYAKMIQQNLTKPNLNYKTLYDGNTITRELYTQMLSIAGVVPKLKKVILSKDQNDINVMQTLAYTHIYLKEFDEAYKIYNTLIDEKKIQDSNTLFLGAISAIGAKHNANAIALLELAKLTNSENFESRYALGLLYHEQKNLEAAAIQYAKVGDIGFKSRFFDFKLSK